MRLGLSYSQEAINVISQYQMEKCLVKAIDDEDAMVESMKAVKAANPKVATYFYMDAWKSRPELTRTAQELIKHPEWMLCDVDGKPVKYSGYYVFDQSNLQVQQ